MSVNNVITIEDLLPYTRYVFRTTVQTPYNSRFGVPVKPGHPVIFKTKAKGNIFLKFFF